jgi:hypothetical protein
VLPRTIGMIIKLPFERLEDYPHVKVRLQQILDDYNRIQSWQLKQREEEPVKQAQTAIEVLKGQRKVVLQKRKKDVVSLGLFRGC